MVHLQYNSSHPRFLFCWTTQYQFRFINTSEVALKFFFTTLPCISLCMYAMKYKYTNTILSNWEIFELYILSGGYYLRLACSTTSNVNFNFFRCNCRFEIGLHNVYSPASPCIRLCIYAVKYKYKYRYVKVIKYKSHFITSWKCYL